RRLRSRLCFARLPLFRHQSGACARHRQQTAGHRSRTGCRCRARCMKPRTYATPAGFKAALEQRLRNSSTSGVELARRRQLLVFDRFLARVTRVLGKAAMLKGGLVLELRLERARTTRDVDLRLDAPPEDTLARLQEA